MRYTRKKQIQYFFTFCFRKAQNEATKLYREHFARFYSFDILMLVRSIGHSNMTHPPISRLTEELKSIVSEFS
jgi:hypothetical protein